MFEWHEHRSARFIGAGELLNLMLGHLQLTVTLPQQCHAPFVLGERIVERGCAILKRFQNAFELGESGFEGEFGHGVVRFRLDGSIRKCGYGLSPQGNLRAFALL